MIDFLLHLSHLCEVPADWFKDSVAASCEPLFPSPTQSSSGAIVLGLLHCQAKLLFINYWEGEIRKHNLPCVVWNSADT